MPQDIFDTLEEEKSRDIFDEIASEPESTPLEREPATFVEPPPIPEMPVAAPGAPFSVNEFTRGDVATPEQQAFNAVQPRFDLFEPLVKLPQITGKISQDALDMLQGSAMRLGATPGTRREVEVAAQELAARPSIPPTPLAQGIAGTVNVAKSIPETFTSPVGIATLGAGVLPKVGQRAVSAAFTADMLRSTPEVAARAGEASVTGDLQERIEAYGGGGVHAGFTGLVGLHAAKPAIPRQFIETVRRVDAVVPDALHRTKEAAIKNVSDASKALSERKINDEVVSASTGAQVTPVGERPGGTPPREAPPAPADTLAADVARERAIAAEKKALLDSEDIMTLGENPKWMELSKEFEDIKNRYQGRKPSDVAAESKPMSISSASNEVAKMDKPAQTLEKGGNKITPETEPERIVVQAEQDLGGGETMPGYVTIQSKGNAQSGPVEAWRAAGHEIPDTAGLPSGTYTVAELKARANEKAIPAATEATAPTAPNQTSIPARQNPVVEPRVGAVPENVSGAKQPWEMSRVEFSKDYFGKNPAERDKVMRGIGVNPDRLHSFAINKAAKEGAKIPEFNQKYVRPESKPASAGTQPFFERESEAAGLGRSSLPPTVGDVRAQRARDGATPDTIETQALDPASGAPVAPPAKPPSQPPTKPAAAAPTPEPSRATLDDVYKIFEPAPKESKDISQRVGDVVESFRTGFSSKFRPLNKLAEDIAAKVGGKAKDVAGIFEQLKGSSGKAEADVYRFDKDVSDLVKGSEKDFNAYVFLRRSLDRLQQDAADIARAQAGENVPKLNRRRVSQYTIPQLEAKLTALSEQIGGEKLAQFNKAAESFQTHMDQALRLQVESGRMAPEVYDAIKAGNQFYAPFKVMKYIEETVKPEGSGRKVDTVADFTKAMEGIDDPNIKLGDMLAAARQNLTLSRTLAEKNQAMQNITELAALDVDGNFVQKLKPGQEAPKGLRAVNVLENGQKQRYAVNENVAEAIDSLGPRSANLFMRLAATTFRAGATTFNLPFQISNILADTPRAALISKYGINIIPELALYPFDIAYAKARGLPVEQINKRLAQSAAQSLRFPLSLLEGIYSSFTGDVVGVKNKLMLDFLDSGAAGTTFQEYMTPGALRQPKTTTGSKVLDAGKNVLKTPLEIAQAVEQINKVAGVKQAMKSHGVESGKALPAGAITELRRFSGSPDFGRMGKWVENYGLNLAQMFLNARIQGLVADAGRLAGRDGMRQAASTWINLGAWVGLPSLYLYMLNNRDEEAQKNYAERPKQEKQNYWLVPKTDDNGKQRYIKGSNGEQVPDYWRIPKRESAKWTGNFVEAGLDFAKDQNPETFKNWSVGLMEDMSPLNVQGKTLTERVESVASGLNPLLKAPLETGTGRDTYRHKPIVSNRLQQKGSPEEQYDERTPDIFKTLADKMPDVAPEVFRSPKMLENLTKNFTAGLLTQFLPRQPVEGRSKAENLPLTQRFQAVPYTDSSEFDQRIQKFERESADEQLKRLRDAKAIMDTNKGAKPDVLIQAMIKKHGRDEKMAERIVDLYAAEQRGVTPQERRVLALPVTQRAEYLADELRGKTPEQKSALLRNWALKRILTDRVAVELAPKLKPVAP